MSGRPREFDRDEALAKARDAFWRRGYEATSMSDLVAELGIASARIYAAFRSKADLFREAAELYMSGEGNFAPVAFARARSGRDAIERMLLAAIDLYTKPGRPSGCMVVLSATNCTSESEDIRRFLAEHRARRLQSIIDRLDEAKNAGEIRDDADTQILGDFYGALLNGLSIQARDGVSRKRLKAIVPGALAAFDACTHHKPRTETGRSA